MSKAVPLRDIDVKGKRVLLRADLNARFKETGELVDDFRVKQLLPTLQHLIAQGARVIIAGHAGSEDARGNAPSFAPIAVRLAEMTNAPVSFFAAREKKSFEAMVEDINCGEMLLLDNTMHETGEIQNSVEYAQRFAKSVEVYVNDSISSCSHPYATIATLPKIVPTRAMGIAMEKEFLSLERAFKNPKHSVAVVIGGLYAAKKINALLAAAKFADTLILGGTVANTFLAAQGVQMGRSHYEADLIPKVLEILAQLSRRDAKVYLPVDFRVGPSPNAKRLSRAVPWLEVPADTMALDIGPASSLLFKEALQNCETIIWNGLMGALEGEEFSEGTTGMVENLASCHGLTVAGGENTYAAIRAMELRHKFDCIVPGDTAFVTLLEGKSLPGLDALGLALR
jgi:phosphoglycerate kinase